MTLTLTIDRDAVAANWRLLAATHGGPTAAVVKADAYGLGIAAIAPALYAAGAQDFFVATPAEGVVLRALLPDAPIFILGGVWAAQIAAYHANRLTPVLNSSADIAAWCAEAARLNQRLPAIIHIDTGMRRLGLDAPGLAALIADPMPFTVLDVRYVMTHLVSAELPDDPINDAQAKAFAAACAALPPVPRSIANSAGIFARGVKGGGDLARPGAALYGINPTPGHKNPMRQTVKLTASVLQLRDIGVGDTAGYNATWRAARPSRLATLACGYADGYLRSLSNRGVGVFDGQRLPLIGRVSMDLLTLDATDLPTLREGDRVELIGPNIPPDEVATLAGTNGYEILTSLSRRADRVMAPV
jgi:alanine racemase